MLRPPSFLPALAFCIALGGSQHLTAQQPPATNSPATNVVASPRPGATNDPIARIRDEGLNRSRVMETLSHLTEVIGPRLTGSPNLKRANEWTRDQLASWGLTNAHLEAWGPFGRGWSLKRFSAQIIEPQAIPLIACPKAWTPGFDGPLMADVVYLDAATEADLEKYKGRLKGTIALIGSPREIKARFEAPGTRLTEVELLKLANAAGGRSEAIAGRPARTNAPPSTNATPARSVREPETQSKTNAPSATNETRATAGPPARKAPRQISSTDRFQFAVREGAALIVTSSSQGDGGTLFVGAATVPSSDGKGTNSSRTAARSSSPWSTNAPAVPAQIAVASEDYNRLLRMIQHGEKLRMAVDMQVQFHDADLMAYNTIAEIPGGNLKDEIVMLGGHLDSWHSGTGATDNGAGVAVALEAVRILRAVGLQPRRTIRVGLWSGEEQGLLGSKAYVSKHFGYYTNITNAVTAKSPKDSRRETNSAPSTNQTPRTTRKLIRQRDYEKFSAYFNLDNGTGKIRGVYLQGNEAVRPIFRRWLEPFRDLGAETLTLSNTGGTDHQSFDGIGLPGFQFIQDAIEYWSRTHHSNMDVFDRIQADDLKQASTIMAAFIYEAAMLDEKLPRKPVEGK